MSQGRLASKFKPLCCPFQAFTTNKVILCVRRWLHSLLPVTMTPEPRSARGMEGGGQRALGRARTWGSGSLRFQSWCFRVTVRAAAGLCGTFVPLQMDAPFWVRR